MSTPVKFDSLESIQKQMPQLQALLASTDSTAIGPHIIASLAEAIATLANEVARMKHSRANK